MLILILAMMLSLSLSSCDDDKNNSEVTSSGDVTTTVDETTTAGETTTGDETTSTDDTTIADDTSSTDETTSSGETTSSVETTSPDQTIIPDEPTPHVHTEVTDKAVAATCMTDGKTEGKHCSTCGEILVAQKVIKAKGHTVVTDKAVAATCTTDGKTEGKHCSVCGAVTVAQNIVKAKGHTEGKWVTDKEATNTEDGKRRQICSVCGTTLKEEVIPAKGSAGLEYKVNSDGKTCTITGIGTCTDKTVVIGEYIDGYRVTNIGDDAFFGCEKLTSINIPDSVTSIGEYAFSSCYSLTSINIPNSVTTIGERAFSWCESLISINIPNSVTTIGESAFGGCYNLTTVNYDGSNKQWEAIDIQPGNTVLTNIKPSKTAIFKDYAYKCFYYLDEFSSPNEIAEYRIVMLRGVSPCRVISEEYYDPDLDIWLLYCDVYAVSDLDKYTLSVFGQTYDYSGIGDVQEEIDVDFDYILPPYSRFHYIVKNGEIIAEDIGAGGFFPEYEFEYDNYVEVEQGKFEICYHYVKLVYDDDDIVIDRIDNDITGKIIVELVDGNYLIRSHTVTHPEN